MNTTSRMDKAKIRHDRHIRADTFKVNDRVMKLIDQHKPGTIKAFHEKWKGPYRIIEKINESNYVIKLPGDKARKQVVNKVKLKRASWNRPYSAIETDIFDERKDNNDSQTQTNKQANSERSEEPTIDVTQTPNTSQRAGLSQEDPITPIVTQRANKRGRPKKSQTKTKRPSQI